jgi:DNA-directed RNA polymerase specialized sigma24 family protein
MLSSRTDAEDVTQDAMPRAFREIAAITSIPIGTVKSSLSRARRQLHSALAKSAERADTHEL